MGGGIGEMDRVASFGGGGGIVELPNVERLGDDTAEFDPTVRAACGVYIAALSDTLDGREEVVDKDD